MNFLGGEGGLQKHDLGVRNQKGGRAQGVTKSSKPQLQVVSTKTKQAGEMQYEREMAAKERLWREVT